MEADDTQVEMENHLRERRQALAPITTATGGSGGNNTPGDQRFGNKSILPRHLSRAATRALGCRGEDLFSLKQTGEIIEGELLGELPQSEAAVRAQVTQIGDRVLVRPLHGVGELASLSAASDGVIVQSNADEPVVKVKLLKEREAVSRKIVVGGCGPAMFFGR